MIKKRSSEQDSRFYAFYIVLFMCLKRLDSNYMVWSPLPG